MINLIQFFNEIPIFFMLALTGYILVKIKILSDASIKGLSGTLMFAAMPALIFSSFIEDIRPEIFKEFTEAVILTAAVYVFFIVFASLLYRKKRTGKSDIAKLSIVFSNCAFMGMPVIYSLFGSEGIIYTSIYILFFNIFLWTYAIKIYDSRISIKKNYIGLIINPGIIAMITGFMIGFFELEMPYFIIRTTDLLGSITTPAAMIIVGALFAQKPMLAAFKNPGIIKISIIRLLIVPVIIASIFYFFRLSGIHINVIVILSAMPAATTIAIMADQYKKEAVFAAGVVGYSTVLSVITVPFIYFLIDKIL